MHLVSCLTPNYLPFASQYLNSISNILSVPVSIVLVGWDQTEGSQDWNNEQVLREALNHVHFTHLPLPESHSHGMIQGGHFLDALPEIEDDEVVVLTDMDIRIQREFLEWELDRLESLGEGEIKVGWNCGNRDTLEAEGFRIGYKVPAEDKDIPCFNCGVIGARVSTWKRIKAEYEQSYKEFYSQCSHRSRIQYLLNRVFCMIGLDIQIMSPSTHLHGHFLNSEGKPLIDPQACKVNGLWTSGGETVLFAHKLN